MLASPVQRMRCRAAKTPANFLNVIFILIASFSIHEFHFAALNKSNYHLPLSCVAHFKHIAHTVSHKAEGRTRGSPGKAVPTPCPSLWPAPHLGSTMRAKLWGGSGLPLLGITERLGGFEWGEGFWRSGSGSGGW